MGVRAVIMPALGFLLVISVLAPCGAVPQREVATNSQAGGSSPVGVESILTYSRTSWDPEICTVQADVSQRWEEQTQ